MTNPETVIYGVKACIDEIFKKIRKSKYPITMMVKIHRAILEVENDE